jgi:plastocyanin
LGAAAFALTLLAAACGDDDDTGTVEEGATTTAAPADDEATTTTAAADEGDEGGEALDVNAVDFGFEGLPEEIDGGAVTINFANVGQVDHEIAFVEMGDTDIDQFFTDFAPVIEGGPFPEYVEILVGANEAPPGESTSFTYTLPEGTYAVFCALTGTTEDPESEDGAPHYELGMQQVVSVSEAAEVAIPESDGTITSVDYSFEADIPAGATSITFTNDGPEQTHFAGIDRFEDGTTPEQAEETFATFVSLEEGEAPPEGLPVNEEIAFSGIASPGQSIRFEVDALEPGTYIAYCFISDRTGGPPHAIAYQMFTGFTVE